MSATHPDPLLAGQTSRAEPANVSRLPPPRPGARTWIGAVRVRQWPKNLLVLAAPLAGGALGEPGVPQRVAISFFVFCLLASGAYLINDVGDAEEDRRHPVKRHRPVASGALSKRSALAAGVACVLGGILVALTVSVSLFAVAAGYALLNALYTTWLRRVVIADIAAISVAFLLRAGAGGVAAGVRPAAWLIVAVCAAALFAAAGKRLADLLNPAARRSRPVLARYSATLLRLVVNVTCVVTIAAYCLWALSTRQGSGLAWRELTIVPFVLAMLRYWRLVGDGRGGAPEQILFGDRGMQLIGIVWLVLFGLGA